MNTSRYATQGGGTSTSSILAGGSNPPTLANAETWNGSAWTEVSDLNTARSYGAGNGASSTDAIIYGGEVPSNTAKT